MLKINDFPYEIDFQLKSLAQNSSKIDMLVCIVLLLTFLTFIPRIVNTYERTILKIGLSIHRNNFTSQIKDFTKQIRDFSEKNKITDLSIIFYDTKNREIYSWSTSASEKSDMVQAIISLHPGRFILGEDAKIIISTYPNNVKLTAQFEQYAIKQFSAEIRMAYMDIVKQFIDFNEHKSPSLGLFGINFTPQLFPILTIFIAAFCWHYFSLYKSDFANINDYFSINNNSKNQSLFAVVEKIIPKPSIVMYQKPFYSPINSKFIVFFSSIYVLISFTSAFWPLLSRNRTIFKSGVFIKYLFEGFLLAMSLLIISKILKKIMDLNLPNNADTAGAKSSAAD